MITLILAFPTTHPQLIQRLDTVDIAHIQKKIQLQQYLLTYDDNELVGLLKWSYFQDHIPYCENIQVSTSHKGQGIGSQLISHWHTTMHSKTYTHTLIYAVARAVSRIDIPNYDTKKSEHSTGGRHIVGKRILRFFLIKKL